MEITNKDFELVDNFLDNSLSQEEAALFRIRMQDEEFSDFVKFQKELRVIISGKPEPEVRAFESRLKQKEVSSRAFASALWISSVLIMTGVALLFVLMLR